MKKLFIFLWVMLACAVASAQTITGSWEVIPSYGTVKKTIETPQYLYVLAGNGLCGYDKTTGEVAVFNVGNRLNGNLVSNIWYDAGEKCLFVAYNDWNIDLMFDDGRTINIPDLRESAITSSKKIQDVSFANGRAYVGFDSGMLVIEMEHGAVTESCIWGKIVSSILVTEDKILVHINWKNPTYVANRSGSHHNFEQSFTASKTNYLPSQGWLYAGNNHILLQNSGKLYDITLDPTAGDNSLYVKSGREISGVSGMTNGNLQPTANGVMAAGGGNIFTMKPDGTTVTTNVPEASGKFVGCWSGDTTKPLWLAGSDGYGQYDPAAGKYTIATAKPRSTSGSNVGQFALASDGRLYMSTVGINMSSVKGSSSTVPYFDIIEDGAIRGINPANRSKGIFTLSINPLNSNDFVYARWGGLSRVKNGEIINYNTSNSSFVSSLTAIVDAKFDSNGNLWALQRSVNPNALYLHYTSAEDWNNGAPKDKWKKYDFPEYVGEWSARLCIHEASGIAIATTDGNGLTVIDFKNNHSSVMPMDVDEDGMSLNGYYFHAITVDKNGWVWVGGNGSTYVIKDPRQLFNPGFKPMRPKVPRNDGTNLADFLLDNVEVYTIHVDESNQKWIGTVGSGLYRVSADGTEILSHLTTENSDIPSDNVLAIQTIPGSNKVYIGTDQGLSIYHATSAPASTSYDNVYAYPNPVTPDYTGYITITGLMDNSLVKIADASGRVFHECTSDGGLAIWNGCDASGNRVKSGVYFVFASQKNSDGTASNAAVTKIVVIN